ncbi:MAG: methyltransferase domain-containing protein [Candidatus Dormibacteraeota bacterium]|nr:methyltransferase domain-containing protein [Candidatus Dormibacteraeota bacterium]
MEEPAPDWWRSWFGPAYLSLYDDYLAERTPIEVDQLEVLLKLRPPARIVDLACGQGRHGIELSRRGYEVTGVDLSTYLLDVAAARARAAHVSLRLIHGDMRDPPLRGASFDVALSLFTSLGYFADEADDRKVLRSAAGMLVGGGRLLLEVLNGQREREQFEPRQWFSVGKTAVMEERKLDRSGRRLTVQRTVSTPNARATDVHAIRIYSGAEVEAAFQDAGFDRVNLYGDWNGEPLSPDSLRVLAVGTMSE